MSKGRTKKVSTEIHYTVVWALVISLSTSFFLGLLIAMTLWDGGLSYFHDLSFQGKQYRKQQAFIASIQQQINEQLSVPAAQATFPIPDILDPDPGDNWSECWQNCHEACDYHERPAICRNECVAGCNNIHPKDLSPN